MSLSDSFAYAIASLLIIQAVLRVKAAWKGRRRERSLWGAFAAMAASWLARTSTVNDFLDGTGILDLGYLVKHATAIIGICVLLRYVTAVYAEEGRVPDARRSVKVSAAVHRIATRASLGTIAVMTATFFFLLDPPDTSTLFFLVRHENDPGLPIYMSLFYAYMGAAAVVCAVQWGGAARRTPVRSARIGMRLMSGAMILAVLYVLVRITFVIVVSVHPVSPHTQQTQEAVSDTLLYTFFLLWGIGAIAPVSRAAVERYRAIRNLIGLHALWWPLATAVPDAVRYRPSRLFSFLPLAGRYLNTYRDVLLSPDQSVHVRLDRYTYDIRDATFDLRRRVPADLAQRAQEHIRRDATAELTEEAAGVRAEALWIRTALLSKDRAVSTNAHASAPYPFDPGTDEVRHLLGVASAYQHIPPGHTAALLADTAASSI